MNIFILGPGRTGKTTLTSLISPHLKSHSVVHSDALRAAIMGLPERFPSEILHYEANSFYTDLLFDFCSKNSDSFILDGSPLTPQNLQSRHISPRQAVFLGFGNLPLNEIFEMIRTHDQAKDWSKALSDEALMYKIAHFRHLDQINQEQCQTLGYRYVDTSKNREEILNQLAANFIATVREG